MAQNLSALIEDADFCIVGIGSEWNWVKKGIQSDKRYEQLLEYCHDEGNQWLLPIVEYEYAYYNNDNRIAKAYKGLKSLIGEKDYFLISDTFLQDCLLYGFDKDKCVFPCGNYRYLQTNNVNDQLVDAEDTEEFMDIVMSVHSIMQKLDGNIGEDSTFSKPFKDGKELHLNQKRQEYSHSKYNEAAYLENWEKYMKYLTGTLNSSLLLLELGVGLDYPTVIRWPFEKVAFVNQKAHLVRVHEKLFHHTPEIADKTDSIQMNSVDYILQECRGL